MPRKQKRRKRLILDRKMARERSENNVKIKIDNLSLSFGGVKALVDVSLEVRENEILAISAPTVPARPVC